MRTSAVFVLGTIMGGVAVWLWGKDIEGYVGAQTRDMRTTAADIIGAVDEKTGEVLDGGGHTLRRAGGLLANAKARLSEALRTGQTAIRPAPAATDA